MSNFIEEQKEFLANVINVANLDPEIQDILQKMESQEILFKVIGLINFSVCIHDSQLKMILKGAPLSTPSLTVEADAKIFLQLIQGELDPIKAYVEGLISVGTGSVTLAQEILEVFQIAFEKYVETL